MSVCDGIALAAVAPAFLPRLHSSTVLPVLPVLLQVAGQYILKQGDEVQFVIHTNLKSGELNAQRVRRTKEGPELPEPGK